MFEAIHTKDNLVESQFIDAHQHFWKYHPDVHSWISDEMAEIRRDFLPGQLGDVLAQNSIAGCVAVQADQTLAETSFLVALAKANPWIKGVVGWVDLCAADIPEQLAKLKQHDCIKGFRHVLQGESPGFMLQSNFQRGIAALKVHNFTYDILIFPHQLDAAIQLVSLHPDQLFVLDHLAKPYIKTGAIEEWKKAISKLASFSNVCCKLSGMVTEADLNHWEATQFTPYLDVTVEAFGCSRLMFGSDWPVCLAAATYAEVADIVRQHISGFSIAEQGAIMGGNASKFYNL